MTGKTQRLGLSAIAIVLAIMGLSVCMTPTIAVSAPTLASTRTNGTQSLVPEGFQVAQAQTDRLAASGLPGGASSLNETYEDWRVACAMQAAVKHCVLSQVQTQENGQLVLAMELNAPKGDTVSGTLVLPFGLALDQGVTFQIDGNPAMQPARFRTCLPVGCIVSLNFDTPSQVALRAGAALKLNATADGGATTAFSISLKGFGTALDRVTALSR